MAQKESLEYEKMNSLINELKMNVNKKEDDIKNIINEKEILIKELNNKIIDQNNKIETINKKLEKVIDIFINEFKEKDKEINQLKLNLLDKEILIEKNDKQIKNIINENIYEINNTIISKEQIISKELNQKIYDLKMEKEKEKKEQIKNKYKYDENYLEKMNKIEESIVEIRINYSKENKIKEIEKTELYNGIKMYKLLEDMFPQNKLELLDKNGIKKYIDLYKEDPNGKFINFHSIKEEELFLKHYKEDQQLVFKKQIDDIKGYIKQKYNDDLNGIKKEYDLGLKGIDCHIENIRYYFKENNIKEFEQNKNKNYKKKTEKEKKIEEENKKKVLEIENIKKENLIQKDEYYNKKKKYIQDGNI